MAVKRDDPRTFTTQIADDLRKRISEGEYRPGSRLPSVRELRSRYGVAGNTVQDALRELQREGLIRAEGNRGNFVRDDGQALHPAESGEVERIRSELSDLRSRIERIETRVTALEEQD